MEYVTNKDKTVRPRSDSASSLQEAVDYAHNREKTECDVFESAIGCTLETAFEDMLANKKRWDQMDGIQGYHLVQSFAEGELTPELAHRIGLELVEKLLCGKYPAVIATHLNTRCLHNHIVWDSVAMDTGRKYRSNARSYYTEVRALSDRLCRQHGLSVINTEKAAGFSMNYGEWMAESRGQPTWRTVIRQDVDEAIASALTWRQFVRAMEQQGYELRMLRKYPTLKPPGKERPVRFKTLGQRYTPEALQMRILYAHHKIPAGGKVKTGGPRKYARLYIHGRPIRGLKGLRALYYRYLYELGALPRKPQYQSYAVRQDIYRLADEFKRQRAQGTINRWLGEFAIRVDELPLKKNFWPWDKTKLYDLYLTDEEWTTARNAINDLRNWRLSVGKGDGGTGDSLMKIMTARYKNAPER